MLNIKGETFVGADEVKLVFTEMECILGLMKG